MILVWSPIESEGGYRVTEGGLNKIWFCPKFINWISQSSACLKAERILNRNLSLICFIFYCSKLSKPHCWSSQKKMLNLIHYPYDILPKRENLKCENKTHKLTLLNSARQLSEQNSFFPSEQGKTYGSFRVSSLHHVQNTLIFRGLPISKNYN